MAASRGKRLSETQVMAGWVRYREKPLTPWSVSGFGQRSETSVKRFPVHLVDIVNMKNHSPPPNMRICSFFDCPQIHETKTRIQRHKRVRRRTKGNDEAQSFIKPDRLRHIDRRKSYSVDPFHLTRLPGHRQLICRSPPGAEVFLTTRRIFRDALRPKRSDRRP